MILEGFIVGLVMLGAIAFVLINEQPAGLPPAAPESLRLLLDDALRVLQGLPDNDVRYSGNFLNRATAEAAAGDPSALDGKLRNLLPEGAGYNVHLDNGYRARDLLRSASPSGERVSAGVAMIPKWSLVHAITDFDVHSTGAGTPMKVRAMPVYQGAPLAVDSLVVNGGFELDMDSDSVPDGWSPSSTTTGAIQIDDSRVVWKLDRAASGTAASTLSYLPADAKTRFDVETTLKGDRACLQVHFYDEDKLPVVVGASETECAATLDPASPSAYATLEAVYEVPDEPAIAYVTFEIALLDPGTVRVDKVGVKPAGGADAGAAILDVAEGAVTGVFEASAEAGGYATSGDPNERLDLRLEFRHRHVPMAGALTYRTSGNPLLPILWDEAQSGLDASTLAASEASVAVGGSIEVDFDFTAYEAALAGAGVDLVDPTVVLRVYEPLAHPDDAPSLATVHTVATGTLAGTWTYDHPPSSLYGPTLIVASLESGFSKAGYDVVPKQEARKAVVVDSTLADGTVAVPPIYRVVVESWFDDWS